MHLLQRNHTLQVVFPNLRWRMAFEAVTVPRGLGVCIHSAIAALSLPYWRRRLSRDYDPLLCVHVTGQPAALVWQRYRGINVCVRWA